MGAGAPLCWEEDGLTASLLTRLASISTGLPGDTAAPAARAALLSADVCSSASLMGSYCNRLLCLQVHHPERSVHPFKIQATVREKCPGHGWVSIYLCVCVCVTAGIVSLNSIELVIISAR